MLKRLAKSAAFVVTGAWVGLSSLLYVYQTRFVYYPTRHLDAVPSDAGLPYEDVSLTTADGVVLHGWYVPAALADTTILFFHGNAGNISHRLATLDAFHRMGVSTFIFDYRGFGQSGGEPSEDGTYRDAAAAWAYLVGDRGLRPTDIIVFGRSLGGALATWLAAREQPRGLILESTFTSIVDLGRELYPYLPVRYLARIRYPTIERIGAVGCPIVIAHSPTDALIPYAHATRLARAARSETRVYALSGGHNDSFTTSGQPYFDYLARFIHGPPGVSAAAPARRD